MNHWVITGWLLTAFLSPNLGNAQRNHRDLTQRDSFSYGEIESSNKTQVLNLESTYSSDIVLEVNKDNFNYTLDYSNNHFSISSNRSTIALPKIFDSFSLTLDSNEAVYFYYLNNQYFTDRGSMEQARKNAYINLYKNNTISYIEYLDAIGSFSSNSISYSLESTNKSLRSYNQFIFDCSITWEDVNNTITPACGVHVGVCSIYNNGIIVISEGYTDTDGELFLAIDLSYYPSDLWDLYLFLDTSGEHIEIIDIYSDYYWKSLYLGNRQSLNFHNEIDINVNMNDDFGKALQFFQCAYYCAEYAKLLNNGTYLPLCTIMANSTSPLYYYVPNDDTIYFSTVKNYTNNYFNTTVHWYEDWDALAHEYGHHVQKYFPLISNGDEISHLVGCNLVERLHDIYGYSLTQALDSGSRTVWCEGWATYFGQCVQKHFESSIGQIYGVADGKVASCNGVAYLLSEVGYQNEAAYGDADEISITQVLYKITYTGNYLNTLGDKAIYLFNLIKSNATFTFGAFYQKLLPLENNSLNSLLANHNITPSTAIQLIGNHIYYFINYEDYGTGLYFPDYYTLTIKNGTQTIYQSTANVGVNELPYSFVQQIIYTHSTYQFQVSAAMTYGTNTYIYYSSIVYQNL